MSLDRAADAAARFATDGPVRAVRPHSGGHIHASFIVETPTRRWLLQRLNTSVFPRPDLVMANVAAVTAHLAARGERTLTFVPARDGAPLAFDDDGTPWRMFEFIEGAVTRETARDEHDAASAAHAFGRFLRALADYAGPPLHETIPGFHDTAARVAALDRAIAADAAGRAAGARAAVDAIARHRDALTGAFARARALGDARLRIAHLDAKIANVLFDARSGDALCVVDLDTVMPGLSLHDFGDLVRSMVSPAAEDEPDPARVHADPARYAAILRGYLHGAGPVLGAAERARLPEGAEAMVFEQAVRFLTDHLEGDRYYRTARPGHNLERARAQLALLDSLVEQRGAFRRMAEEP